jgi:hypothetical protein
MELCTASDTGVPVMVTEGAAAVIVCSLITTGAGIVVLGDDLDKAVGEEKRGGPRRVGGDMIDTAPFVDVYELVPPTF